MNKEISRDETYQHAIQFMENFSDKHEKRSNLYVFTTVDRDGNVVDEKYGMNMMTNVGYAAVYANGQDFAAGSNVKLYVGLDVSQDTYHTTEHSMRVQAFGGLAATNDSTSHKYDYPLYYSKGETDGTGLITLISRFMTCHYAHNITNYSGQYELTEYGIGTGPNDLWTHSRIYDIRGNQASITKDSNVELHITVYMCLSFSESIIMNGWAHNRFTMITTNYMMYDRMGWSSKINLYKRDNTVFQLSGKPDPTMDTTTQNAYTISTLTQELHLYDNNANTYDSGTMILNCSYFDGYILKLSKSETIDDVTMDVGGFISVEPEFLSTPEDVEFIGYLSGDPTVYTGFADKFGRGPSSGTYDHNQWPQMTHFFNASAYIYDYKNHGWTCALDIYNPDSKWYDDTPAQTNACLPIFYANNNRVYVAYVYQNLQPNDRITAIVSGAVSVYATNKYWAVSEAQGNQDPDEGWVWIRDYRNIPQACQTARYWITNTSSDSLTFVRQSDCFQLLLKGTNSNGYENYPEYEQEYYIEPISDNYAYGWYKRGNKVYVPAYPQRTPFTVGSDSDETMTFGKWMIVFPSTANTIIRVDMTNATSGVVTPENVQLQFTGSASPLNACHRTQSGTGLIVLEASSIEETVVIDLRQNSFAMSVHSWKHACSIWGTNKIAYINAGSSDPNVYIYDYDTGQNEGVPIPFPNNVTDIPHLFAHTNYLWMTNGSTFGYACDLRTPSVRNLDGFDYTGMYGTNLHNVMYTCVDDVFIVYNKTECGNLEIKKAHYIRLSEPLTPRALTAFDTSVSSDVGGRIDIVLRYVNQYTNSQSQPSAALVMLINRGRTKPQYSTAHNGADSRLFDFGHYLCEPDDPVYCYPITSSTDLGNQCLYGESLIYKYTKKTPIIDYLPIKLIGKTDTINAMKYIKKITGKSWLLGYTNTPLWGDSYDNGKPPGLPMVITDRNGNIIRWSW